MQADNEQIVNDEQPKYVIHTYKRSLESLEKHRILKRERLMCQLCNSEICRGNITTHNKSDKHRNLVFYNEVEALTNDKSINTYKQIKDALLTILSKAKPIKSKE